MTVDLGTLIGSLLAEVTRARMSADVEAARIAEFYQADPLLRHMPVPRFRLPDVRVTLPVVVEDVEGAPDGPTRPQFPDPPRRKAIISSASRFAGLTLKAKERASLLKAIDEEVRRLDAAPGALRGAASARRIAAAAERGLAGVEKGRKKPLADVARRRFGEAVLQAVQADLAEQLKSMHRMRVLPRTQDVHTVQDQGRVMEVELSISEEAYELRLGQGDDGEPVEHFGPE